MNLRQTTETFAAAEDQRWLGSAHGTVEADSITLDADDLLTDFPTGVIPSGVVLGKVTATGLYRRFDNAAVDGTEVPLGHLFTTVDLGGTTAATVENPSGALFWHGEVVVAKLPTGHNLHATNRPTQIKYV